jgi:hypothetical protein
MPHGRKKTQDRLSVPEVRAVLAFLLETRTWDVAEVLKWHRWRVERNRRAAASHAKRRAAELKKRLRDKRHQSSARARASPGNPQ